MFAFGWLGVLLLAADGIGSLDRLKTLIRRMVMGATAMAALGVTQFFIGVDLAKYIAIPGLRDAGRSLCWLPAATSTGRPRRRCTRSSWALCWQ